MGGRASGFVSQLRSERAVLGGSLPHATTPGPRFMTSPLLLVLTLFASTITVDDDGPADFTEISDAILAAAAGDVLLVEPGNYGPFFLDKDLSIVGRANQPRPNVAGPILISRAPGFALSRLRLQAVTIEAVTDAGRMDDCRVRAQNNGGQALLIQGCAQIELTRSRVTGNSPNAGNGGRAGRVTSSNVTTVDTDFIGGAGAVDVAEAPNNGGTGLRVDGGSHLLFVRGSVIGGAAGGAVDPRNQTCSFGQSGRGLVLAGATASLRGVPADQVSGGAPGPRACGGVTNAGLRLQGGASVVTSGVTINEVEQGGGGGTLTTATPFEPYLRNNGSSAPGGNGVLQLFGPASEVAILIASFDTTLTNVAGVQDTLWFDPATAFFAGALVSAGPAQPALCPYTIPEIAAHSGLALRVQCVFTSLAGSLDPRTSASSNAVDVIVNH